MGNNTGSEKLSGIDFLQKKYQLNSDPGVVAASKRSEQRDGDKTPDYDYRPRVQKYLDRLSRLANPTELAGSPGFQRKERNIDMLKRALFTQVIIKPDEIPEGYFQSISKRNQDQTLSPEARAELAQTLITDQKNSLGTWVDYLTSSNSLQEYPDWFKYFTLRSVLLMGKYDKDKAKFGERSKKGKTLGLFPELNIEALSFVFDAVQFKNGQLVDSEGKGRNLVFKHGITLEERKEFLDHLKHPDVSFSYLYAWAINKYNPVSEEQLRKTEGLWKTYPAGSDPKELSQSLSQYGTGWCIRGLAKASEYLQGVPEKNIKPNEVTVYFSKNTDGKPVVPRIVIITRDQEIIEVRGIAHEQNFDPYITEVAAAKLKALPNGKKYDQEIYHMRKLTNLHRLCFKVDPITGAKTYLNPVLSEEQLGFIYEVERPIKGFGYKAPDPRIKEIRKVRNPKTDHAILFNCSPEQIALSTDELRPNSVIYLGRIVPNIFRQIPQSLKYLATSASWQERIRPFPTSIGGKTRNQLQHEIFLQSTYITEGFKDVFHDPNFATLPDRHTFRCVTVTPRRLGFTSTPTVAELYSKAKELGLELCPLELVPHMRLQYKTQTTEIGSFYIATDFITRPNGDQIIFGLAKVDDKSHIGQETVYSGKNKRDLRIRDIDAKYIFKLPEPPKDPSQT